MPRSRRPGKSSWWRRVQRNKAQLVFWILGLLVVLSMVLSLVIGALPQPEPPTPTPTPLAWQAAHPWEAVPALPPVPCFLRAGV